MGGGAITVILGPVHSAPEEFEVSLRKRIKCFPFTLRWKSLITQNRRTFFHLCLFKTLVKLKLDKIQARTGFEPASTPRYEAVLYQLSYQEI